MFACTKFQCHGSCDIGFWAQNRPKSLAWERWHSKNISEHISPGCINLKIPFYLCQSTFLAAIRIFSVFQNIVRSSPKLHATEKLKTTKLHHRCYFNVRTMQTKFSRFCHKKLWLLSWTPKDLEKSTLLVGQVTAKVCLPGKSQLSCNKMTQLTYWPSWILKIMRNKYWICIISYFEKFLFFVCNFLKLGWVVDALYSLQCSL